MSICEFSVARMEPGPRTSPETGPRNPGRHYMHTRFAALNPGYGATFGRRGLPRCGEDFPGHHEDGRDQRSDDKAVEAEHLDAAQRGNQHEIIRQLGILADQERTQQIVHEADHQHPVQDQADALPHRACRQQIDRHAATRPARLRSPAPAPGRPSAPPTAMRRECPEPRTPALPAPPARSRPGCCPSPSRGRQRRTCRTARSSGRRAAEPPA